MADDPIRDLPDLELLEQWDLAKAELEPIEDEIRRRFAASEHVSRGWTDRLDVTPAHPTPIDVARRGPYLPGHDDKWRRFPEPAHEQHRDPENEQP